MLIFLLSIIVMNSSDVVPNRRARVQSILVVPIRMENNETNRTDFNSTSSTITPAESDLFISSLHPQANPGDVIVDMEFIPETCADHMWLCYKETPKGVFVVIGASMLFILGCLLILFLWK